MAPGITFEKQVRRHVEEHLRLRRKGSKIMLVWEDKSSITPGKIWTTKIAEVSALDIPEMPRRER